MKALELNPHYSKAYFNKGHDLNILKQYENAFECFDQAICLNPDYADPFNGKGYTI